MKRILTLIACLSVAANLVFAGNPDRRGEAGAYELVMDGWAGPTGLWDMNSANVMGLQSDRINIAGLAFVPKTEVSAGYTLWLQGAGVGIAQAAVAQNIKNGNVIALDIQALDLGSIEKTSTANPEGGIGTYSPIFVNIGLSYARKFSNSISGGFTARLIDEGIGNLNAFGACIDGGLQYVTGPKDNIHFGVSLRNVGTPMKFTGDAITTEIPIISSVSYTLSEQQKTNSFELPTQLNIGAAYDLWFGRKKETTKVKEFKQDFRLTFVADFTSNAFGNDFYGVGAEFGWKEIFMLRGAFRFENGIFNPANRVDVYTGPAAGFSINIPFSKENAQRLSIDYSFRATSPFAGTHSFGLRLNL